MKTDPNLKWHFIFWEPEVSSHMRPLAIALAQHPRVGLVKSIAHRDLALERAHQGWEIPIGDGVEVTVAPDENAILATFDTAPERTIHVIMGMRRTPTIVIALREAQRRGVRYGIFSEPRVFEGVKGVARLLQTWLTEITLRRTAGFVLAVGRHGPAWFQLAGYPSNRIFPFAYFVAQIPPGVRRGSEVGRVRLGYVGRLVRKKGIHVFLAALKSLPMGFTARVVGSGDEEPAVRAAVAYLGGSLELLGTLPMSKVPAMLHEIDILIVPSITKDDGWAAVISEALMTGALVVASNCVGGSICLDDAMCGEVVRPQSTASLVAAIKQASQTSRLTADMRKARQDWARACVSATAGADYLLNIVDHIYGDTLKPSPYYFGRK